MNAQEIFIQAAKVLYDDYILYEKEKKQKNKNNTKLTDKKEKKNKKECC